MLKWCKIKPKRQEDEIAVWEGRPLGIGKPHVNVVVHREEDLRLPRPRFKTAFVKPKKDET